MSLEITRYCLSIALPERKDKKMASQSTKTMDLTTGPLFRKILKFIFPLILTNLLHQFYNAADMMIVGLSTNPNAVGAVGSSSSYLALITNIFIGFSVGAEVVVARYIGAGEKENASRATHTALCMSLLFGVLGSLIGIVFARPMMILMGYSDPLLSLGLRYTYIYLACIPFISLTNFLGAILRANGNTRTSLYVLSATGILNILLNLFFVLVVGLSVEGVAIATAIANLVSSIILWHYLTVQNTDSKLSFKKLRISKRQFGEIARVGFPAGIQNALFSVSNMIIQSSIVQVDQALTPPGSAYAPVIKGNTATASIENFIFTALGAVSATASTFTGQNVGKQDYKRVRAVLWQLCLIASVISILMSAGVIIFHKQLFALYGVTEGNDILAKIAYETALKKAIWKWPTFLIYAIMNTCAGVLRGLGKSTTSALISFVGTCVFRVVWIYTVFRALGSLESIYISYPISWLLTGIFFMITVLYFLRRIFAQSKVQDESIKA